MTRDDWAYVNLEKELVETVDDAVESLRLHGGKKYVDRKDFIRKAIQALLNKEGVKNEEVASH